MRGRDGKARAFYNVCRHRGTRVCEAERGRFAGGIQCPYHAWTYGLDGALLGAPHMADVPWFDKAEHPLAPAALGEWEGFLFLNLAADPQPLDEALAPLLGRFAPWRLPLLATARQVEYEVAANWKLIFQNFSECYHCPPVHPALAKLSHYRSGANDLRDGSVLGGYMLINEPGGSLTMSGRLCGAPLGDLPADERQRVYYYSIFPGRVSDGAAGLRHGDEVDAARRRPHARLVRFSLCARNAVGPGIRSGRRRRDLGRHEPAGLAHVRARAEGRLVARVSARRVLEGREPAGGVRPGVSAEHGADAPLTLTLSPLRGAREISRMGPLKNSLSRRERDGVRGDPVA